MSIEIRDLGGNVILGCYSWHTQPIEEPVNLPTVVGSNELKIYDLDQTIFKEFGETFEVVDGDLILKVKVEEI
jgi:hypothetical protein